MHFQPAIPIRGTNVPAGPDWLSQDQRLPLHRSPRRRSRPAVHPQWSRPSGRYPCIVESALKNRTKHFVIDGEALVLGVDGIADFDALHSGSHNDEVQFYVFDCLALDGDDLRGLHPTMHKTNLERLLARGRRAFS